MYGACIFYALALRKRKSKCFEIWCESFLAAADKANYGLVLFSQTADSIGWKQLALESHIDTLPSFINWKTKNKVTVFGLPTYNHVEPVMKTLPVFEEE